MAVHPSGAGLAPVLLLGGVGERAGTGWGQGLGCRGPALQPMGEGDVAGGRGQGPLGRLLPPGGGRGAAG